ncbi:MAG: phosphatase, partial [Bacteriovoracaceae bacterium]|nr:phosphatase [Bacteriovoracaceae bacterium]
MDTADLHFHTTNSDGKHSVQWVVEALSKAKKNDLSLAVLTDHDGVAGFEEFSEGVRKWWTPICASELSCSFTDPATGKDRELHLLMYGLDPHDPELVQNFDRFKKEREARFFKICEKLEVAGFPINGKAFAEKHPGVLGRPHVADALIVSGIVQTRKESF